MNTTTANKNDIDARYMLTPQQVHYFDTFGYLKIPGLFKEDIEHITEGFEEAFVNADTNNRLETFEQLHGQERRIIIPGFLKWSEKLKPLQFDPRVVGIARSLIGPNYQWAESDGNLFDCESYWHSDTYSAPLTQYHVKFSFYLDSLTADSGAIRVMPGSHFLQHTYGKTLQRDLWDSSKVKDRFGVDGEDLPGIPVESEPGDLIIWNFRTVHGSYNGNKRRRLFSLNFAESDAGEFDKAAPEHDKPFPLKKAGRVDA